MSSYIKIVVFVPKTHTDIVRKALGDAGAGKIGNYSHCSYSVDGKGRFLPLVGAKPAIGDVGKYEEVLEERIECICERDITKKVLDYNGVSTYPRTSGDVQKVGPSYWEELKKYDVKQAMLNLEQKTDLTIIHPLQDEIIGNENLEGYKTLKLAKYIEINGDHSWAKPEERKALISVIKEILI